MSKTLKHGTIQKNPPNKTRSEVHSTLAHTKNIRQLLLGHLCAGFPPPPQKKVK